MEEKKKLIRLTPGQARLKMESWCAYQERGHQEVKDKLYAHGLNTDEVNDILSHLIQNNFLNEERFASAYVSGKFKIKGWGRNKIKQNLRLKKVSEANIKNGIKQIDADEYYQKLLQLADKKNRLIKEKHYLKRRYKLTSYLVGKGYETDLVSEAVKQILKDE